MLPSERLRLNASKSESLPVRGDAAGVPPEGGPRQRPRTPFLPWGAGPTPPTPPAARRGREPRRNPNRRLERDARSLADDLGMDRGVVPSRAAASLRSAETKPFDPRDLPAPQTGESFGRPAPGTAATTTGGEAGKSRRRRARRTGGRGTAPGLPDRRGGRRERAESGGGPPSRRAGPGERDPGRVRGAAPPARERGSAVGRSAGREMGQSPEARPPANKSGSQKRAKSGGGPPSRQVSPGERAAGRARPGGSAGTGTGGGARAFGRRRRDALPGGGIPINCARAGRRSRRKDEFPPQARRGTLRGSRRVPSGQLGPTSPAAGADSVPVPLLARCPESGEGRPGSGRPGRARLPARRRPTPALFFASRCADSGPPKAHVSIGPVSAFASPGMVHLL